MTVARRWFERGSDLGPAPYIDVETAHPARVYDYWNGGKDNFAVDRAVAEQVMRDVPVIVDAAKGQRAFLRRVVRHLATTAGIRQFLDIGTGIPGANNTHEVAQAAAPDAAVVYVDNDPIVLAHARALLSQGSGPGRTAFLQADLRDTDVILGESRQLLDFGQPTAILLIGILQLIPDSDDPASLVRKLIDAVPSGSYLAIGHPTADVRSREVLAGVRKFNERASVPVNMRSHAEISRFLEPLDMLAPGLVQVQRWHPEDPSASDLHEEYPIYVGLGRKP